MEVFFGVLISVGIAVAVWVLFLVGSSLGVQWYVSAVAILLIGRYWLALFGG